MNLFTIASLTVHLWLAELLDFALDEQALLALLSPDEVKRAMRFKLPLHSQRFIITRGLLRKTLSLYTGVAPDKIVFNYGEHGKPHLQANPYALQFNVSHSADIAIFALTTYQEIGVDIEKIEPHFREDVAKRFFSSQEYAQLMDLTGDARNKGFYQIWSRKEALIKAAGKGLFTLSSDFSINLSETKESVSLMYAEQQVNYYIENIYVPDGYQAAIATTEPINNISNYSAVFLP